MRIGIVAEDFPFFLFLSAAIKRLATDSTVHLAMVGHRLTRGCSAPRLNLHVGELRDEADLTVVGVDSFGPTHSGPRHRSFRQKRSSLDATLSPGAAAISWAVAFPSVEAWLLADAVALKRGLEGALNRSFEIPEAWPSPKTEREAKQELGRVVFKGLGEPLPRAGWEFCREILSHAELLESANKSLSEWAREFTKLIRGAGE